MIFFYLKKDLGKKYIYFFFFNDKVDEVEAFVKPPDESLQNSFKSLPTKSLCSSTLVSQPVKHVSSFLVMVKMFLVPNGTSCLI